jgi:hypothetical protein
MQSLLCWRVSCCLFQIEKHSSGLCITINQYEWIIQSYKGEKYSCKKEEHSHRLRWKYSMGYIGILFLLELYLSLGFYRRTDAHEHSNRPTVVVHEISHSSTEEWLCPMQKKRQLFFVLASTRLIPSLHSCRPVFDHYFSYKIAKYLSFTSWY